MRSSVRGLATSHQEAQQVVGVRLFQHSDVFELEYLVSLADQRKLWLSSDRVADDLKRNYENDWWAACRKVTYTVFTFLRILTKSLHRVTLQS